jgi:hypothetical protein
VRKHRRTTQAGLPVQARESESVMNRTIDVRTEMRKLADSKPVHAAAGASALASERLRELTAWLAKWRDDASMSTLSSRASGYVTTARTRAAAEYDKLAKRGEKALNGRSTTPGKGALNGRPKAQSHQRSSKS